jgi:Flp pilus assembly protein TadD
MLDQPDSTKDSPVAPGGAPSRKDGSRDWVAGLRGLHWRAPGYLWQAVQFTYENFASFVGKCLTAIVILVVLLVVYQGLTRHVTVVDTISVPKPLVDRGYSQDVAAQRFRDALAKFSAPPKTGMTTAEMTSSAIALHNERLDIVVPTVGISLDAVMSLLRSLLRSTRSQSMGGELTIDDGKLWLRLRLNGVEFYRSKEGGDPENPDQVFAAAARDVLMKIAPSAVAQSLYNSKKVEAAFEMAKWITIDLPEDDENVLRAYNLRGIIQMRRKDYTAAEEELRKAIAVDKRSGLPHISLGDLRRETGKLSEATAEYREAVRLNSDDALAHNQLGLAFGISEKLAEALQEYREAVRLAPKEAIPHNNVGVTLHKMKDDEGAVAEYRQAIELNPDYPLARTNLAYILLNRKDFTGAAAQDREAIRIEPDNIHAHGNLADSLVGLGQNAEAAAEYREFLRLQPKDLPAQLRLAETLDRMGKQDDAVTEFQAVLKIDPNNKTALDYLKNHSAAKDKPN